MNYEKKAEQIGLEVLINYEDTRRNINLSEKNLKQLNRPISREILRQIRVGLKEHISLQTNEKPDRERSNQFNKKLEEFNDLFEGYFRGDESLINLMNSPNRIIPFFLTQNSKPYFLYWSYYWDDNDQFVLVLCRLKAESYYSSVENNVQSYYSKALEVAGWADHGIYFKSKYGSINSSKLEYDYRSIALNARMSESTEFLHYVFDSKVHQFYFGSIFDSIPNQRIIFRVNSNNFAIRLIEKIRQLSLYKLAMIGLIPSLALLISGLISWRLRKLRLQLERMNRSGGLFRLQIEGRDQISDLSIQINRLLTEPLNRDSFVKLKEELKQYHNMVYKLTNHKQTDNKHYLVYIILEHNDQKLPKILAENIIWISKDNKYGYFGWCCLIELIKTLSEYDVDFNNGLFKDFKLCILRMDYGLSTHQFRAVTEVPSIIPILTDQYNPFIESKLTKKNAEFQIFTTVDQEYRDLILKHVDMSQKWKTKEYKGLNGYYLS